MGEVVWINGPFSAGKTSVANALAKSLDRAFLLDPEFIGVTLRDHLVPPSFYPGDFQDLALWRSFTRDAVLDAALRDDTVIVVPMTVARPDYFEEIVGTIRDRIRLHHFTLMASREEILRRELGRPDDTGAWAAKTVDRVLPELAGARYAEHLDAEAHSAPQLAAQILARIE
jgi:chloramphenicol 3-O-phosphotransferase